MRRMVPLALLAACAAPTRPTPPVATVAALGPEARLVAELVERCGSCHDGRPGRPQFEGPHLDRGLALRAALMLSAGKMPPPSSALTEGERAQLIDALCDAGADDHAACRRALARTVQTSWVRTPTEYLRALDTVAPRPGPATVLDDVVAHSTPSATRVYHLSPTLLVFKAALAVERCHPPKGVAAESAAAAAAIEACTRAALDGELSSLPRASSATGGAP